jgi:hypothetical protein
LARKHNLADDVAYFDLALREKLPLLATSNAALRKADLAEGAALI